MKREIKFRAWDEQTSQMVYVDRMKHIRLYDDRSGVIVSMLAEFVLEISPKTPLMQYTGLKDNRKELYEGDIISESLYEIPGHYVGEQLFIIEFNHSSWKKVPIDRHNNGWILEAWNEEESVIENVVIVGNIYENPEIIS